MKIGKRKLTGMAALLGLAIVTLVVWDRYGPDPAILVVATSLLVGLFALGWLVVERDRRTSRSIRRLEHRLERSLGVARDSERRLMARFQQLSQELPGPNTMTETALRAFHAASTRAAMEQSAQMEAFASETMRAVANEHRAQMEALVSETKRALAAESKAQKASTRMSYSQVESLLALYFDIRPRQSFPSGGGWEASPDLLLLLYKTIRERQPELVVECGSGVSTVVIAYALAQNEKGQVVALEHLAPYRDQTEKWLRDHELTEQASVILAPLVPVTIGNQTWDWYSTEDLPEGPIGVLFVDGPPEATGPTARFPALPLLENRTTSDTVVILDDSDRQDEREIVQRWTTELEGWHSEQVGHNKGTAVLTRAGFRNSTEFRPVPQTAPDPDPD